MNEELIKRILSSIVLIPFVLFFIIEGSFIFNFFILICLLIVIYEWNKISNNIILKFLGFIFILFSFYTIYRLRNDFNESYEILLLVTLICISTDLGGYFFGKLLKGPKLTKLSPNKTYAGMIGSFMLSILLSKI